MTLATDSFDGTVRLWDVATRRPLGGPLTGGVDSLTFSPDGKTLVTGDDNGTVQAWDMANDRQIGSLIGHLARVLWLAFSPDGKTLVTGSADGTVRRWNTAYLVNVVPQLCASAGRSLTRAEWTQYAQGLAYQSICP
jgi:WD40 repeat protein